MTKYYAKKGTTRYKQIMENVERLSRKYPKMTSKQIQHQSRSYDQVVSIKSIDEERKHYYMVSVAMAYRDFKESCRESPTNHIIAPYRTIKSKNWEYINKRYNMFIKHIEKSRKKLIKWNNQNLIENGCGSRYMLNYDIQIATKKPYSHLLLLLITKKRFLEVSKTYEINDVYIEG